MKSTLILFIASIFIGSLTFWVLVKKKSAQEAFTLPSPHITEGEQVFLTNITTEQIHGWTLHSPQTTLAVTYITSPEENPSRIDSQSYLSDDPYWHVHYQSQSSKSSTSSESSTSSKLSKLSKLSKAPQSTPRYKKAKPITLDFKGEPNEILANARNFLSLSYVSEDPSDRSPLKALSQSSALSTPPISQSSQSSQQSSPEISSQSSSESSSENNLKTTQKSMPPKSTPTSPLVKKLAEYPAVHAYSLTVKSPASSSQSTLPSLTTMTFLEGEAVAPFRKLYFQGKAYWVREWYILALTRSPEDLYRKAFLTLSPHTLERVEKRTFRDQTTDSHVKAQSRAQAVLDFTVIRTAPYIWEVLPPTATQASHTSEALRSAPPKKTSATQEQSQEGSNPASADKVTAFIETLLFLKAERALVLLSEEERAIIQKTALAKSQLTLTSRTPKHPKRPKRPKRSQTATPKPSKQSKYTLSTQVVTLYHHEGAIYAEISAQAPLYLLPSQKPLTLLHYGYDDFLN